jgi:hypothetical protein
MRRFVYYNASRAAAELLLDLYTAAAAYSVRKLRTAYTGACIRVRRSSDNAEQDIGFVGGQLNTASLLSFVGAGDGFVVTWYDQQGVNDLTQTSSSAQPQIVSTGSLITRGGKAAIKFDGSNDKIEKDSASFINKTNISFFSVANGDVNERLSTILSLHSSSATTLRVFNDTRTTLKRNMVIQTTTLFAADLSVFRNSTDQILLSSFVDTDKNMSAFDNGETGTTSTYSGEFNTTGLTLGVQAGFQFFHNGTIQEVIVFNTNESTNRIAIETNINNYYGIY